MGNCRDITCFDLGYYAYESSKHIDQTINDFAILAKHLVCSTYETVGGVPHLIRILSPDPIPITTL